MPDVIAMLSSMNETYKGNMGVIQDGFMLNDIWLTALRNALCDLDRDVRRLLLNQNLLSDVKGEKNIDLQAYFTDAVNLIDGADGTEKEDSSDAVIFGGDVENSEQSACCEETQ